MLALDMLDRAGDDGLSAARYTVTRADNSMADDVTLSAAVLHYAHDLHQGFVAPEACDPCIELEQRPFDSAAALRQALTDHHLASFFQSLVPQHAEYTALKASLAHYRTLAATGGWPALPSVTRIDLNENNADTSALRARLAAEGFSPDGPTPEALRDALTRFQRHAGLVADGVAGRKTIAALDVTAGERAATITANLERWRWLHDAFPLRYVAVDAADASLVAMADGAPVLTSRVIVGARKTPTPIFKADAVALTINPAWNIPASITKQEILPRLAHQPHYLTAHHMIWVEHGLRQLPGEDNALGRLKVEMPNRFNTYLHDTNAKPLFAKDERHLSHGCIRVQQVLQLASWLLSGDSAADVERLRTAITESRTQRLPLDKPVPIYVLYQTAIPKPDGTADFRPDIYGRDAGLSAALAGQSKPAQHGAKRAMTGCTK